MKPFLYATNREFSVSDENQVISISPGEAQEIKKENGDYQAFIKVTEASAQKIPFFDVRVVDTWPNIIPEQYRDYRPCNPIKTETRSFQFTQAQLTDMFAFWKA